MYLYTFSPNQKKNNHERGQQSFFVLSILWCFKKKYVFVFTFQKPKLIGVFGFLSLFIQQSADINTFLWFFFHEF